MAIEPSLCHNFRVARLKYMPLFDRIPILSSSHKKGNHLQRLLRDNIQETLAKVVLLPKSAF